MFCDDISPAVPFLVRVLFSSTVYALIPLVVQMYQPSFQINMGHHGAMQSQDSRLCVGAERQHGYQAFRSEVYAKGDPGTNAWDLGS